MTQLQAELHAAAKVYDERGICCVPVQLTQQASGKTKKKGLVKWKIYQTRRPTVPELRHFFTSDHPKMQPDAIGIIGGEVSNNLAIRDWDDKDSFGRWAGDHPALAAELPLAKTKRGFHAWFESDRQEYLTLSDGEFRGDSKHLSVAPPSRYPDGTRYEWIRPLPAGRLPQVSHTEFIAGQDVTERPAAAEDDVTERTTTTIASVSQYLSLSVTLECITQIIDATLPQTAGQRNQAIFALARRLKGIPELAGIAVAELRPVVAEWHKQAAPIIATKEFSETWGDFAYCWPRVKTPHGKGVLETAVLTADSAASPQWLVDLYDVPALVRLGKICIALQSMAGTGPFFLACGSVAETFDTTKMTASRWLAALRADGLLTVAAEHTATKATRYRWTGGKVEK